MKTDILVLSGRDPITNAYTYGYITTLDIIPAVDSLYCNLQTNKAYKIIQLLHSNDRNIAVALETGSEMNELFNIPGI